MQMLHICYFSSLTCKRSFFCSWNYYWLIIYIWNAFLFCKNEKHPSKLKKKENSLCGKKRVHKIQVRFWQVFRLCCQNLQLSSRERRKTSAFLRMFAFHNKCRSYGFFIVFFYQTEMGRTIECWRKRKMKKVIRKKKYV